MFLRLAVTPLVFAGFPATEAAPIEALLKTSVGEIRFELYPEKAPKTVANFLKYVDGGHFEGGSLYRVVRMDNQEHNTVKIEVIQGGLLESGTSTEYDPIPLERTSVTGLTHRDGTLLMARSGTDAATSEFFIFINDQPSLDFGGKRNPDGQGFAAFGRVIEGMDIVRKTQRMNTIPPNPDELEYTSGQYLETPVRFLSFKRN